jgi:hypothetical protein
MVASFLSNKLLGAIEWPCEMRIVLVAPNIEGGRLPDLLQEFVS